MVDKCLRQDEAILTARSTLRLPYNSIPRHFKNPGLGVGGHGLDQPYCLP